MVKGMWNYAIKTRDLEKSIEFYTRSMRAELRIRGEIYGAQYVLLRMGETRLILFDKAPYEEDLGLDLPPGFLHVVYEVDDFESEVERLREAGVKFFMEPRVLRAEFGLRKIAFFEAPDGIRTEIMQVLEDSGKN